MQMDLIQSRKSECGKKREYKIVPSVRLPSSGNIGLTPAFGPKLKHQLFLQLQLAGLQPELCRQLRGSRAFRLKLEPLRWLSWVPSVLATICETCQPP